MSAKILDGKAAAARVMEQVRSRAQILGSRGRPAGLATVLVGDDPGSAVYVRQKIKACEQNGIKSVHVPLPVTVKFEELLARVRSLNEDIAVSGIIVQLPLPAHIRPEPILEALDPRKDADGLHPLNQGRWTRLKDWKSVVQSGVPLPCTPAGVMELLEQNGINPAGKSAVVVGRSTLVGKPLAMMLMAANATVTVCHSGTKNIEDVCRKAEILVAAMGVPKFVKADMVRESAVVIDVGISRTETGLVGDVDFDPVAAKAAAITPVPGGVGPMTVAMLLRNTVLAAERLAAPI